MEEKISIVTTVYNTSKTLGRCLDSLLAQTYDNLEIIVVNDASTDNSLEIAEEYAAKHDNIKVINLKVNRGAGYARSTGIDNVTGDLIGFVDSDDEVHKDFYKTLYSYITKYKADIVWSPCYPIYEGQKKWEPEIKYVEVHEGKDVVEKNIRKKQGFNGSLSYRRVWKDIEYCKLRYIEDTPTFFKINSNCKKGVLLDYNGYYYYENPLSICHTASDLKTAIYRVLAIIEISNYIESKGGTSNKAAFISLLRNLKTVSSKYSLFAIYKYRKEILKIINYFINKIL